MNAVPTLGVEEEYLFVEPISRLPASAAGRVILKPRSTDELELTRLASG